MKALNFLEWFYHNTVDKQPQSNIYETANFYNQPFTVYMLVNPIELGKYSGKIVNEDGTVKAMLMGEKDIELFHKWQQSESLRLFEGWELKDENIININRPIYYITQNSHGLRFCSASLGLMYFNTLNDFITLCNLSGIELQFNKSNETIKKLFGKE